MSETLVINEIYLSLQGESTFAGLPCIFIRLTACDLRCSYCDTAYAFNQGRRMTLDEIRKEVGRIAERFKGVLPEPQNGGESAVDRSLPHERQSEQATSPPGPSPPKEGREVPPSPFRVTHRGQGPMGQNRLPLVELTGGEPLLQKNSVPLMKALCDDGFTVLLETSGAHDIAPVDRRVRRIMDLKCPSSGESMRNRWENLQHLAKKDEIKFVIGTREDYEWAKSKIAQHSLEQVCLLLFSWVHPLAPEQQDKSLKSVPPGQTPLSQRELAEAIIADALPVRLQLQMHKIIWPPTARGV